MWHPRSSPVWQVSEHFTGEALRLRLATQVFFCPCYPNSSIFSSFSSLAGWEPSETTPSRSHASWSDRGSSSLHSESTFELSPVADSDGPYLPSSIMRELHMPQVHNLVVQNKRRND